MSPKTPTPKFGLSNLVAEWLWEHLDKWSDLKLITPQQRDAIKGIYLWPPHVGHPAPPPSKPVELVRVLQILGAILTGIGLLTLVATNWPGLSSGVKLGIVLTVLLGLHGAGLWLQLGSKVPRTGEAFSFLGNLVFGAGIWLLAQTYHLPGRFPEGLLLWAVGILPTVLIQRSQPNYFLSLILFVAWTLSESIGFKTPQPQFLLALLGALVPLAYWTRSRTGLAICLLTGGVWLWINHFFWTEHSTLLLLLVPTSLYGLLLLGISNLHAVFPDPLGVRAIYRWVGGAILITTLFLQPFAGAFHGTAITHPAYWVLCAILGLAFAGTYGFTFTRRLAGDDALLGQLLPFWLIASLWSWTLPFIHFTRLGELVGLGLALGAYAWFSRKPQFSIVAGFLVFPLWLAWASDIFLQSFGLTLLYTLYGLFAYLYGWDLLRSQRAGTPDTASGYKFWGLLVALGSLGALTFQRMTVAFLAHPALPKHPDFWVLTGLLYAGVIWLAVRVYPFAHPRAPQGLLPEERVLAGILLLLPPGLYLLAFASPWAIHLPFALNLLLLFMLVVYLIAGYRRNEGALKSLAFLLLSVIVTARYVELDWNLGYKVLLFIPTGLVVLLTGILVEKNKTKVVVISHD